MSSPTKIDNRKKDILILGKCPPQGLKNTWTAEKMYLINFNLQLILAGVDMKFCLRLHYNGANSYLFVMAQKLLNSKQNILKL